MGISGPLSGKRIGVTRAREQANDFAQELEMLGAEVFFAPLVSFGDPEDTSGLDEAIRQLEMFDWILFTSANAVCFFSRRLSALGRGAASFRTGHPSIAAVGPATERAAKAEGFRVSLTAAGASGTALAAELGPRVRQARVLLPRSDRARTDLPEALRSLGAMVTEAVAYRTATATVSEEILARIRGGGVDVLTFASPSAFRHLADLEGRETLGSLAERCVFAAIGPTTAEAIRSAGIPCVIEAAKPDAHSFARAIADHFQKELKHS